MLNDGIMNDYHHDRCRWSHVVHLNQADRWTAGKDCRFDWNSVFKLSRFFRIGQLSVFQFELGPPSSARASKHGNGDNREASIDPKSTAFPTLTEFAGDVF